MPKTTPKNQGPRTDRITVRSKGSVPVAGAGIKQSEVEGQKIGGPLRERIRNRFVRESIADGLVENKKFSRKMADLMAELVSDEEIDAKLAEKKVGSLGDGSFLQWLTDHKDQILQVILFFIQAFAMFGKEMTKAMSKPVTEISQDEDDEEEEDDEDTKEDLDDEEELPRRK